MATLFASIAALSHIPGRVVRVDRSACIVELADGPRPAVATTLPAVGDWVALVDDGEGLVVDTVLTRSSQLVRQDPASEHSFQVLAANMDDIIVVAPLDRMKPARIERELLVAWDSGARPTVVVTKTDLALDGGDAKLADLRDRVVGIEVIATSSVTGKGIDALAALFRPDRTGLLIGPSGAGKSTLVNALLGEDRMDTGAVREADSRGRHTTTARHLLPLPGGGAIIDTPGIRSIGLWEVGDGLAATFADVEEIAAECRFADCRHLVEPGCQVQAAVADGRLAAGRLTSYRKLQREVSYAERAQDRRARENSKQRWKIIAKANRARPPKGTR